MTHLLRHARRPSIRIRGVSLVEALVAMAVMAFGMLAVVGVQSTLRINGDVSKQRSEATRLAERELERVRSFSQIDAVAPVVPAPAVPQFGWSEVANQVTTVAGVNATYTVTRKVSAVVDGSSQKAVNVEVTWDDRLGHPQSVVLGDTLAGAAPVLSGLVSVAPVRTGASQYNRRHPTIPSRAHDLGDGGSVFKPTEGGTVAWKFNNATGVIFSVCTVVAAKTSDQLRAGDLVTCTDVDKAQLLSGYVRFNLRGATTNSGATLTPVAGGAVVWGIDVAQRRITSNCINAVCNPIAMNNPVITPPLAGPLTDDAAYSLQAVDSENPHWPSLPLRVPDDFVTSDDRPETSAQCYTNAPASAAVAIGQTSVEYFCIIFADTSESPNHMWNGRTSIAPGAFIDDPDSTKWTIGTGVGQYRVCRYTRAATDVTTNADHPLDYHNVSGNLINQNFLIIAGPKSCPTDVAVDPASGDFVNSNTRAHQS